MRIEGCGISQARLRDSGATTWDSPTGLGSRVERESPSAGMFLRYGLTDHVSTLLGSSIHKKRKG